MKRTTAFKFLIILSLGFICIWPALFKKNESTISPQHDHAYPLLINGLSGRVISNGITISRLAADELKVIPRKFFFFNIASINEAVLTNAKIEIYLNNIYSDADPFRQVIDSFTGQAKVKGLITRFIINGISTNIYNSGILTHRMNAVSAGLFNNNQMVFYNVALEHPPTKRHIMADVIIWDTGSKKFIIPGWYSASSPSGKTIAKGLQIDLNFDLTPIKETKTNGQNNR